MLSIPESNNQILSFSPIKVNVKLSDIKFDPEIYPRSEHSPAKVQEYAENMEAIEAKENYMHVSKDNVLLDGRHRHLAYLKLREKDDPEITVYRHDVESLKDKAIVAVELNSSHGQQLIIKDKEKRAQWFYNNHIIRDKDELAKRFSVTKFAVDKWLADIIRAEKEQQREQAWRLWLQAYTPDEIAEKVDLSQRTIYNMIDDFANLVNLPNLQKHLALFEDQEFELPIYNVWAWTKKTNEVSHFGNSEQRIVENLLYLYTEPFDLVVDPFAGGGSTLDVCMKRLRRCWVSDRKPIVERAGDIRKHDIVDGLPFTNRWGDVTLTYLDPPYWKQAEGKYSKDKEDLANMSLEDFTSTLVKFIEEVAAKQKKGIIALLISPTQQVDGKFVFVHHAKDVYLALEKNKRLVLENEFSVPYSTQQYRVPQFIEKVKAAKKLAVLTRELIIWRIKDATK